MFLQYVQFNLEYEVRLQEFILSIQERLESEEFDKILQHCTPEQQQKLREYRSFLESTLKLLKEQLLEIIKQREQCKQHEQSSQL